MSPYQRTLQMYCPFISSNYCAKSCFSKTLQLRVALVVHEDEEVQRVERRDLHSIHCSLLPTGDPRGARKQAPGSGARCSLAAASIRRAFGADCKRLEETL